MATDPHPGKTHFVGDDCPGGHTDDPLSRMDDDPKPPACPRCGSGEAAVRLLAHVWVQMPEGYSKPVASSPCDNDAFHRPQPAPDNRIVVYETGGHAIGMASLPTCPRCEACGGPRNGPPEDRCPECDRIVDRPQPAAPTAEDKRREAHAYCLCLCTDKATEDELGSGHECTDGRCGMLCCKNAHAAIDAAIKAHGRAEYERALRDAGYRREANESNDRVLAELTAQGTKTVKRLKADRDRLREMVSEGECPCAGEHQTMCCGFRRGPQGPCCACHTNRYSDSSEKQGCLSDFHKKPAPAVSDKPTDGSITEHEIAKEVAGRMHVARPRCQQARDRVSEEGSK